MKITVVMERFCDLNPKIGTTSAASNVIGSLSCTDHSFEVFYYDEYLFNNGHSIDEFLIERCRETKPDLLMVSYFPVDNHPVNIKLETFRKIKNNGTPVSFIWFDAGHPHIERLALKCSEYNTLNVIVDVFREPKENFLAMWVPQDERLLCWQDNKSQDVCFVGSRHSYDERRKYLSFLNGKVNLFVSGGQREGRLTIEQYAQCLKDSKISLNFPSKSDGTEQCKSRVYESMLCGCILMERANNAITNWFEPMVDYIPFTDEDSLLKEIRYYLNNESERLQIVKNGHEKMKEKYSAENWWNAVITRARSLT